APLEEREVRVARAGAAEEAGRLLAHALAGGRIGEGGARGVEDLGRERALAAIGEVVEEPGGGRAGGRRVADEARGGERDRVRLAAAEERHEAHLAPLGAAVAEGGDRGVAEGRVVEQAGERVRELVRD